jgi:MFS transporter, PPP family, 3-phenylpropionic acid transporter
MMKQSNQPSHLLPSLLYFFYFAASACVTPYLNLFFQNKGISLNQIGLLSAMPMGLTLLAAPVWAGIADYFGLHRRILPLIMALAIPFMLMIAIGNTFGVLLPAIILYGFCNSPIMSLSDNSVLSYLGENRHQYGNVRLWGSVSWAVVGWITGWVIERFGPGPSYVGFVFFMLLEVWVALKLPEPEMVKDVRYWENLGRVLKDSRWIAFLSGSFMLGISFTFLITYMYLFMKTLGATNSLTGMAVAASSVLEIPFFIYSGRLLKKVSPQKLILISFVILIIRSILTSQIVNPVWGVAVNLLNGPFYSVYWTGSVNYAREIAPRGLLASAQAFFAASFYGLGGITGAILGGWLYASFGAPLMFQVGAGIAALGLLVYLILGRRVKEPKSTLEQID